MSITLPVIDISVSNNPFTVVPPSNLQLNQISYIGLLNESPYTLQFMAGGVSVPIPAWTNYPIEVSRNGRVISGASLPISIGHTLLTNTDNVPTLLYVTFYSPGEAPSSTIPIDLTRQVASNVANATSVTNTGFANNTIFISASVVGDSPGTSNFTAYNNGTLILGSQNYPGNFKLENVSGNGELFLTGIGELTWTFGGVQEIALQGSQEAFLGQPILTMRDTSNVLRTAMDAGKGTLALVPAPTSINGGTAGTATAYADLTGTFKRVIVQLQGFQTSASAQDLLLPIAFTFRAEIRTANTGLSGTNSGIQAVQSGGVGVRNMNIFVTPAILGDAGSVQTIMYAGSRSEVVTSFDTIRFQAGGTALKTSFLIIEGV